MRFTVEFNQTSQRIAVQFKSTERLPIQFKSIDRKFNMAFQSVQVVSVRPGTDYYEGEYGVVPAVTAQRLETKKKFLVDDIKIREIPIFNVSNTSGGSTVYIGKEVD